MLAHKIGVLWVPTHPPKLKLLLVLEQSQTWSNVWD
jgi:hypothetical protein